jgi:hypothetical protein
MVCSLWVSVSFPLSEIPVYRRQGDGVGWSLNHQLLLGLDLNAWAKPSLRLGRGFSLVPAGVL